MLEIFDHAIWLQSFGAIISVDQVFDLDESFMIAVFRRDQLSDPDLIFQLVVDQIIFLF